MTNANLPFTPKQKQALKTAAALVRITWEVCGTDRDRLLNAVQEAVDVSLGIAFDKELVWELNIYEDPQNASTYRALARQVREVQARIAAREAKAEAKLSRWRAAREDRP
jgi:hypothetical protein